MIQELVEEEADAEQQDDMVPQATLVQEASRQEEKKLLEEEKRETKQRVVEQEEVTLMSLKFGRSVEEWFQVLLVLRRSCVHHPFQPAETRAPCSPPPQPSPWVAASNSPRGRTWTPSWRTSGLVTEGEEVARLAATLHSCSSAGDRISGVEIMSNGGGHSSTMVMEEELKRQSIDKVRSALKPESIACCSRLTT